MWFLRNESAFSSFYNIEFLKNKKWKDEKTILFLFYNRRYYVG